MLEDEVSHLPAAGYRSVEVQLANNTGGNLVVSGLANGPGCSWIANEAPSEGGTIGAYESATWGVYSNDIAVDASGQVQLTIAGSTRMVFDFSNTASGSSQCTVSPTDGMQAIVQEDVTGDANHAEFAVQLIP